MHYMCPQSRISNWKMKGWMEMWALGLHGQSGNYLSQWMGTSLFHMTLQLFPDALRRPSSWQPQAWSMWEGVLSHDIHEKRVIYTNRKTGYMEGYMVTILVCSKRQQEVVMWPGALLSFGSTVPVLLMVGFWFFPCPDVDSDNFF